MVNPSTLGASSSSIYPYPRTGISSPGGGSSRENLNPWAPSSPGPSRRPGMTRQSSGGGGSFGKGAGSSIETGGGGGGRSGTLSPLADSSEEEPSPHSSIFEAPLASDSEGESIGRGRELGLESGFKGYEKGAGPRSPGEGGSREEEGAASTEGGSGQWTGARAGVRRNSSSRQVQSHLDTIVEQKSVNKLGDGKREEATTATATARRRSTSSADVDGAEDEEWSSLLPKVKSRRRSKSRQRWRSRGEYSDEDEYQSNEESYFYDYTSPTQPIHPVISPVALNPSNLPSPALTPPISASFFNRNYSPSSPIRSSPIMGPTFRPPVSGYRSYGTLSNHPFHHAPIATRGAPTYGTRDAMSDVFGGIGGGDGAGGSGRRTPDSLGSPGKGSVRDFEGSARGSSGSCGSSSGWRFWAGTFCCCLRVREAGE